IPSSTGVSPVVVTALPLSPKQVAPAGALAQPTSASTSSTQSPAGAVVMSSELNVPSAGVLSIAPGVSTPKPATETALLGAGTDDGPTLIGHTAPCWKPIGPLTTMAPTS